jgi:hypothetical protein
MPTSTARLPDFDALPEEVRLRREEVSVERLKPGHLTLACGTESAT